MPKHLPTHRDLTSVRKFALSLQGAREDFPFGHSVMKVKNKVFAFLGTNEQGQGTIALKLPASGPEALKLASCNPTGYGLGKRGWVTVAVRGGPSAQTLRSWVRESYEAIACSKPSHSATHLLSKKSRRATADSSR